jgi:hypothetical protein
VEQVGLRVCVSKAVCGFLECVCIKKRKGYEWETALTYVQRHVNVADAVWEGPSFLTTTTHTTQVGGVREVRGFIRTNVRVVFTGEGRGRGGRNGPSALRALDGGLGSAPTTRAQPRSAQR